MLGDAFCDAYDKRDLGRDRLLDTGSCQRRASYSPSISQSLIGRLVAYGTKIAVAFAPVSFTPWATFAKTGRPRWVWPAFLGLVPPTTFVPVRATCQK